MKVTAMRSAGVHSAIGVASFVLVSAMGLAQDHPSITLRNDHIITKIYLPDAQKGFYKGTRFDWSGVIAKLTADGKVYHDQWFDRIDPNGADFAYDGSEVVNGPASAIMGLPEEFNGDTNVALGYAEAPVGGTFIKIGVGVLRKSDKPKYDHYEHYKIIDGGKRTAKFTKSSVTFTQELLDKSSGYGYLYTKTIRLVPDNAQLVMEHTFKNIGTKDITSRVYDHNFLTLNHLPPGPDFSIKLPFAITPKRAFNEALGFVQGNEIHYKKELTGEDNFAMVIGGYSPDKASDYDILIENKKENARFRVQGDKPLDSIMLWSMRRTISMEPYIRFSVKPGEQTEWTYNYTYGSADK